MWVKAKFKCTLQNFYTLFLTNIFYITIFRYIVFEKLIFCTKKKFKLLIFGLNYFSKTKTLAPKAKMSFLGCRWNLREQKNLPWVIRSSVFPICTQSPPVQRSMTMSGRLLDAYSLPHGRAKSTRTQWLSSVLVEFRIFV